MANLPEPFSWEKLWGGFSNGVGWIKAATLAVRILVIVLALGIPALSYHQGYKTGNAAGYSKGYSQAITEHPPQVYNGAATVNNNPSPKPVQKFGLSGFGWTLGACHI